MGTHMSNLIIRETSSEERLKLKEIIDLAFPRFFRYFANHSVLDLDGAVLVGDIESTIAGFVKLINFNCGHAKYGCILWIAVHPTYRLRGIALALTTAGVGYLKEHGSGAVFASTQRGNKGALAALGKAGFERMGFLALWRFFGWRLFGFYSDIWYAPTEVVLMHD
jgi:ribosomal protein S18 acetylase RimI-like enzyme